MFDKISKYITDMIYSTMPDVPPEKREIIEYGVYMTASEIVKIGVLLLVSLILKIVPYVAAAIAFFGIQRTLLGGIHAKTHLGCVLAHSGIVFGIVAASMLLDINRLYLLLITVPFSYLTAYLYAPADLPQKPIKSKRQRTQLRVGGFILLTALFTASCFLPALWSRIIIFSCLLQAFCMTPIAYKITNNKYGREEVSV